MNIYHLFRGATLGLPPRAIASAVVVSPTGDLARGLVAFNELVDRELAEQWLNGHNNINVIEMGPASVAYLDKLVEGDNVARLITLEKVG